MIQESRVRTRCSWASDDPLYCRYHDEEWGVPLHVDQRLFEFLVLEGAQAGLSWITILRKRDNYRAAFDDFDATRVAGYDRSKIEFLLKDAGIVRNRLKVESVVINAQRFLDVQEEFGSFDAFVWQFVDGQPRQNTWRSVADIPASTNESETMCKELRKRGFKFVGATICYAFMQATGMVNDHTTDCYRHRELSIG